MPKKVEGRSIIEIKSRNSVSPGIALQMFNNMVKRAYYDHQIEITVAVEPHFREVEDNDEDKS